MPDSEVSAAELARGVYSVADGKIESPSALIFDSLISLKHVRRRSFQLDPAKRKVAETLGYITRPYVDDVVLTAWDRKIVANYLAEFVGKEHQ